MGEIIARNMLSWLKLSTNRYCCIIIVIIIIIIIFFFFFYWLYNPGWVLVCSNFLSNEYFYWVQLLAARPTPNLEDQGVSLCWVLSFELSSKGGPTSSYATACIALRVIALRKPSYPAMMPSSRWRYLKEVLLQLVGYLYNCIRDTRPRRYQTQVLFFGYDSWSFVLFTAHYIGHILALVSHRDHFYTSRTHNTNYMLPQAVSYTTCSYLCTCGPPNQPTITGWPLAIARTHTYTHTHTHKHTHTHTKRKTWQQLFRICA